MKRLWLLRHAKAAAEDGRGDRERPLAEEAGRALAAIGAWAEEQGLAPALVLCSSAVRTRQTLAQLLPHLAGRPEIKMEEGLYLATAEALLTRLRRVAARCEGVLVVGHNPGLHELAVLLAAAPGKRLRDGMPTGALAAFELDGAWAALDAGAARLREFVTPKELRD